MSGRMIIGAFLMIAGGGAFFLGLMFIIASAGGGRRLTAGLIITAAGFVLLVFGFRMFLRAIRFSPEGIKRQILRLAKLNHGELTREAITGAIGTMDEIEYKLEELIDRGIARAEIRGGRKLYLFPDFQLKVVQKKCPYCGSDYPVRENIEYCPNCGGDLKLSKTLIANGEKYSMDEDA